MKNIEIQEYHQFKYWNWYIDNENILTIKPFKVWEKNITHSLFAFIIFVFSKSNPASKQDFTLPLHLALAQVETIWNHKSWQHLLAAKE